MLSLDTTKDLLVVRGCVHPFSKRVDAERSSIKLRDHRSDICHDPACKILRTLAVLELHLEPVQQCDWPGAAAITGPIVFEPVVTLFVDATLTLRGTHAATTRRERKAKLDCRIAGVTNISASNLLKPNPAAPSCLVPGSMEGRFVAQLRLQGLVGSVVSATYCLQYDEARLAAGSPVRGFIEGVLVMPCDKTVAGGHP